MHSDGRWNRLSVPVLVQHPAVVSHLSIQWSWHGTIVWEHIVLHARVRMDSLTRILSDFSVFEKKLTVDDRHPFVSYSLTIGGSYRLDIFAPLVNFYVQVFASLAIQVAVGLVLNCLIYFLIIKRTPPKTTTAVFPGLFFGFLIVFPIIFGFPYWACVYVWDIRNVGFRLGWCSLPLITFLHTLEAMYGFTPLPARQTLKDYLLYSGLLLRPKYNKAKEKMSKGRATYIRATKASIVNKTVEHIFWMVVVSICMHLFAGRDYLYEPFSTRYDPTDVWIARDLGQLYNTFIQAVMLNFTLCLSWSGVSSALQLMTQMQYEDKVTDFPMFLSTSPSDFWGRRWNNLIHQGLKQGVYKPVRWNTNNAALGKLAAFVVSGMFHEWTGWFMYSPTMNQLQDQSSTVRSRYQFGRMMLFFAWNGVLMVVEENKWLYQWLPLKKYPIPHWLQCHLVVMLSLPLGHLLTHDMMAAGYLEHLETYAFKFKLNKVA